MEEDKKNLEGMLGALSSSLSSLKNAQAADDGFGVWLEVYCKALRSIKVDGELNYVVGQGAASFASAIADVAVEKYKKWG